jgi:DNA-binding transcriptional regulator GbsR (MarR family)
VELLTLPEKNQRNARSVIHPKPASMLVNPINASILRHLSERELSLADLARLLGYSKSRISYHLKRLEEEHLIRRTREEYYRGGIRKFYVAVIPLQLPKLSSLAPAELESHLLPIKAFLWGYILGKLGNQKVDLSQLVSEDINRYAHEIAERIEKIIDENKDIDEEKAELLYLKLLYRFVKLHLQDRKIKIKKLVETAK